MGSISSTSHHWLLLASGADTHTLHGQDQFLENRLARTWFDNMAAIWVHISPSLAIQLQWPQHTSPNSSIAIQHFRDAAESNEPGDESSFNNRTNSHKHSIQLFINSPKTSAYLSNCKIHSYQTISPSSYYRLLSNMTETDCRFQAFYKL